MLNFLKGGKFKTFLIVICALLAGAVIAVATASSASPVTSAVGSLFSPVQKVSAFIASKDATAVVIPAI